MMTRRLLQLLIGLALYGVSLAMVIRASLGRRRGMSSTRGWRAGPA